MPDDPTPDAGRVEARARSGHAKWPPCGLGCPLGSRDSPVRRGAARALAALDGAFHKPSFWGELFSGAGAVACGVVSWWGSVPLEDHPTLGVIARLIGGHVVEATWIVFGAAQIAARATDVWPWRGLMALAMTAGWAVPALATLKSDSDAPVLVGSCGAWVAVNFVSAIALMRRGPPGPP